MSTYNYAENEPIGHIDLHGLQKAKYVPASERPKNYQAGYRDWVNQNPNVEITQTFGERLYSLGQWLGIASPSARIVRGAGVAADVITKVGDAARVGDDALSAFSKAERGAIGEAKSILNSDEMATLKKGFENGEFTKVDIDGRQILFEPDIPANSGIRAMTLDDGFVLSSNAFKSSEELVKTVLQEIHRLNFSSVVKTGSASAETAATTTKNAFEFAEEASKVLLQNQ